MGRVKKSNKNKEVRVALCGNPNVGKSTLFNSLTGKRRHTGNWSGKTVDVMSARVCTEDADFIFYDIPGTYSLISHSKEEEIAVEFLCLGKIDLCVYICDATAIFRSLPLLLQIKEAVGELIVCLNFLNEAQKHDIILNKQRLSELISCPVIALNARNKRSSAALVAYLQKYKKPPRTDLRAIKYPPEIEKSASRISSIISEHTYRGVSSYFVALRLLEGNFDIANRLFDKENDRRVSSAVLEEHKRLFEMGITGEKISDMIVGAIIERARLISDEVLQEKREGSRYGRGILDKILCGKFTAYPIMALFLALCFFITLRLASYPSAWLEQLFIFLNSHIFKALTQLGASEIFISALCNGILDTLFTVIAVMLPPMAIFFPMFSLLEEAGYLPRIAYNLDRPFAACHACGKQALTMCMGLGCNAVGVSESRIIDSERERLLAILTNSFVPCNGRFPILASIGGVFVISLCGAEKFVYVALFVTLFVIAGMLMTFPVTRILSATILKGEKSSFTIELPPIRRPEICKVILISLRTKVLSVLWRAVAVAAPMGLVLFLLSYITVNGAPLMLYLSQILNPAAALIGLDGVILLSFILALPASEMVIPITVSLYSIGSSFDLSLSELLLSNGFTPVSAVCMCVFCLFHFPCSTTLITVYKETKSVKYTVLSALMPTLIGIALCAIINIVAKFAF